MKDNQSAVWIPTTRLGIHVRELTNSLKSIIIVFNGRRRIVFKDWIDSPNDEINLSAIRFYAFYSEI